VAFQKKGRIFNDRAKRMALSRGSDASKPMSINSILKADLPDGILARNNVTSQHKSGTF
jgi:hypothetical protein